MVEPCARFCWLGSVFNDCYRSIFLESKSLAVPKSVTFHMVLPFAPLNLRILWGLRSLQYTPHYFKKAKIEIN